MKFVYIFLVYIMVYDAVLMKTNSARILCAFPTASISHQYVFRAYTKEMANRGHELVIITTDPLGPNDEISKNVTEIDVGFTYDFMRYYFKLPKTNHMFKRGTIVDQETWDWTIFLNLHRLNIKQFNHENVKNITEDRNQHFDLLVIEGIADSFLMLTEIFKAPVISFSTFCGFPEHYEAMGAVSRHPVLHPHVFRSDFAPTDLWNGIKNIYYDIKYMINYKLMEQEQNKLLKTEFGPSAPTILELRERIDLLFINSHEIYDNNRAVPPSVVYLGSLHLQKPKTLPEDLISYLNNSKRGVVYVSLGTNVQSNGLDKGLLNSFVDAFGSLPYDVLWKFDAALLEKIPDNVKIRKWFPQRDILVHPNIKLFVTQGGLQSTDETIDAVVPVVCIPFFGDQWFNCHRSMELGIGVKIDPRVMTAEDLTSAISRVIQDESFKNNVEKIKRIINDQPQTPIERAAWWTEYVIRHGGARHLRSSAANMSWSKYLILDVIIPVLVVVFIVVIFSILLIRFLYKKLAIHFSRDKGKLKDK